MSLGLGRGILVLGAIPAAFLAGMVVARSSGPAQAQAAPLTAQIVDLAAITDAELGAIVPGLGTLRSRTLVVLPQGTLAVQTGDVPKHMHAEANEFQLVVSGSGTFWLGDSQREIHPGSLIIIPKGVTHAGSHPSSGEFKVLSIKMPPQGAGDLHLMP